MSCGARRVDGCNDLTRGFHRHPRTHPHSPPPPRAPARPPTRPPTLSDGHDNIGLSAEPDVSEGLIDERDRFFVVASDGVWDMLSERDVAVIVAAAGGDAGAAAAAVCEEAREGWDSTSPRRDDITAIVCFVEVTGGVGESGGGGGRSGDAAAVAAASAGSKTPAGDTGSGGEAVAPTTSEMQTVVATGAAEVPVAAR